MFFLSNGQAAVERGFSLNKEMLMENLQQKSLRMVYDYMTMTHDRNLHEYPIPHIPIPNCEKFTSQICSILKRTGKSK